MSPGRGPFFCGHAVHDRVADGAVAAHLVAPHHAVFFCAQPFDGALRGGVLAVGAPPHHPGLQSVKGVRQQHELARGVHMRALAAGTVPGVSNFQAPHLGQDIMVARCAQHPAAGCFHHGKRQAVALLLHAQCFGHVGVFFSGRRNESHPQAP